MNRKKWMVAVVTVVLFLLVTACSDSEDGANNNKNNDSNADKVTEENFNATGFPIVNEPITLDLMGMRYPIQGAWEDLKLFKELEELTNIKFNFDTPSVEGYTERLQLTFAGNDLPDLFFGGALTPQDESRYGSQGMLIPLEDLIADYAPNIQKMLDENPAIARSLTSPDGHIYGLPHIHAGFGTVWPKFWINQVWLDELDLEMPQTVEELQDVLKAFKEHDSSGKGTIPLSSVQMDDIRAGFLNAFGYVTHANTHMAVEGERIVFTPIEENYKAYLTYMKDLYAEELLDPETFSQTMQQKNAKGADGRIGMFFDAAPFITTGMDLNDDYTLMPPLTSSVNNEQIAVKHTGLAPGAFAITKDNPHPEATIELVDYFYSEEGALLMTLGEENVDWEFTEDGGLKRLFPDDVNTEEYRAAEITPDAGGTSLPKDHRIVDELFQIGEEETDPINYGLRKVTDEVLMPHAKDQFPDLRFTDDELSRMSVLETDILTYVEQMEARFINGNESLDNWEQYVSTLERMNVKEFIEIYQTAYDRWKSAD